MNELIQELAMQANDKTGNLFDLNHKELNVFLEKFAEAIVRDCASLAYDGPGGILDHFGLVEE